MRCIKDIIVTYYFMVEALSTFENPKCFPTTLEWMLEIQKKNQPLEKSQ